MKKLFTSILVLLVSASAMAADFFIVVEPNTPCTSKLMSSILTSPRYKNLNNLSISLETDIEIYDNINYNGRTGTWVHKEFLAVDKSNVGYKGTMFIFKETFPNASVCTLAEGMFINDLRTNKAMFYLK